MREPAKGLLSRCPRMNGMAFFRSRTLVVAVAVLTALGLFVSMAVMFI